MAGSGRAAARECAGCGRPLSRYNSGPCCQACVSSGRERSRPPSAAAGGTLVDGVRLAQLRRDHGWTQDLLADRAGLSAVLVKKLEQGVKPSARLSSLAALARALGVPISVLLGDSLAAQAAAESPPQANPAREPEHPGKPVRPTLMRSLITQRHWQKFRTFEAQFRRAARDLAQRDGDPDLAKLTVSSRQWERWYSGNVKTEPHPDACRVLEHMFGRPVQQLLGTQLNVPRPHPEINNKQSSSGNQIIPVSTGSGLSDFNQLELLRREMDGVLSQGAVTEASLDDWERTAIRYARATRDRPADVLLSDISRDLAELRLALGQRGPVSAMRRLTRVAAQMSGLMCLIFCLLDDRPDFRRWARTARLAADEAGDLETLSWVLAQEAYGHYYSGDRLEAIDVARHAYEVVRVPCTGAALAAALEARAHAALGRHHETREALGKAESILSQLDGDALIPSAFGYNEASFRFHEGNAYMHLRAIKAALKSQERALELTAPDDYTDWAMTRLDRAQCLMYAGDVTGGLEFATETVKNLTGSQRRGIVTLRGREVIKSLPEKEKELVAARDFRDLLTLTGKDRG
jgi:transcriptional regulator with XRE-family HTH domain/tetratricopeptide (TPR) repeat protein